MQFRTILLAVAAVFFAAFLYSNYYDAIPFGNLSPFEGRLTPSPTPGQLVGSSSGCNAEEERGVTIQAPLPIDFDDAFAKVNNEISNGVGGNYKPGNTITIDKNRPSETYFRIKKSVPLADEKIDPYSTQVPDAHWVQISEESGKPIYWTYKGTKYGGLKPLWMIVYKKVGDSSVGDTGDTGEGQISLYDIFINQRFVDRFGGVPDYMKESATCSGGGGLGSATLTEENCGNSSQAATIIKLTGNEFAPKNPTFQQLRNRGKVKNAYIKIGPDERPENATLIGDYSLTGKNYSVYYSDSTLYFENKVNTDEVLMFGPSSEAIDGPTASNSGFYLCTIKFAATSQVWSWFTPVCKPAVYLYPPKETLVNVKVMPKGPFTYTNPVYPEGGWNALASPNGALKYQGKNYDYLYYEASIPSNLVEKPTQGWVVAYQDLPYFYEQVLPKLGLNNKEAAQFKEYWEKYLPKKDKYFVGLVSEANINAIEPMTINPKPDNIIRVRFYFRPATDFDHPIAPSLTPPNRSGFDVMDWGGIVEGVDGFSCVQ